MIVARDSCATDARADAPHFLLLRRGATFRSVAAQGAARCTRDRNRSVTRVRALVKESAATGFALKEVPEPTIREDEVLIRVRRAGVCGTDVHIYDWDDWARGRCRPPFVVGHGFAGAVVRAGSRAG